MNRILMAFAIALCAATSRLVADAVVPPHLRWWLTPVIALQASLLTSAAWWILLARHKQREAR